MYSPPLDIMSLVALAVLAIIVPLTGIWDFQRLGRWLGQGRADARTRTYAWIMAMEWGLVVGFVAWWLRDGRSLASLGLLPAAEGWQWLAVGLGVAAVAIVVWQMVTVMGNEVELRKARGQVGKLGRLIPRTPRESQMFGLVAMTAGVCEEILYRGVLLVAMTPALGIWPAVALSSLVFGLGHTYQGLGGIVKTSLVGLILALLTVFSGSLFLPMLLHTVIDLASGRIMGAAMKLAPVSPAGQEA